MRQRLCTALFLFLASTLLAACVTTSDGDSPSARKSDWNIGPGNSVGGAGGN